MAILVLIAALLLGLWLGLSFYFTRLFNRSEPSRMQRIFNGFMAAFAAGVIVFGVAIAILMAVCSGMRGI